MVKGQQLGPGELRSRQLTPRHHRTPLGLQKEGPALLQEGEEGSSVGQQTLQGPFPPLLLEAELLQQALIEQCRELLLTEMAPEQDTEQVSRLLDLARHHSKEFVEEEVFGGVRPQLTGVRPLQGLTQRIELAGLEIGENVGVEAGKQAGQAEAELALGGAGF